MNRRRHGFTLVEVIVVLVVLAILAAILIPTLTGYIRKANERAALAEARSLVMAAQTLASEEYGDGSFNASTFIGRNRGAIVRLADLTDRATLLSLSFQGSQPVLSTLTCVLHGHTVRYDAAADPKYAVTQGVSASGASDFWNYAVGSAENSVVSDAGALDRQAKALQALFVEQFGANGRTLSADEAALFHQIGTAKSPDSYHWLPTYAADGSILLIGTNDAYRSDKSNYNASLIYHDGNYYYFYANKNQHLGAQYVGDKDFDTAQLTGAGSAISADTRDAWIKLD